MGLIVNRKNDTTGTLDEVVRKINEYERRLQALETSNTELLNRVATLEGYFTGTLDSNVYALKNTFTGLYDLKTIAKGLIK